MHKNIVVLPGDGIGPEVTKEALKVLQEVGKKMGMEFDIHEFPIGGVSLGTYGVPIQDEVVKACKDASRDGTSSIKKRVGSFYQFSSN
jgi:3-isopropylmalate dehydrogenase